MVVVSGFYLTTTLLLLSWRARQAMPIWGDRCPEEMRNSTKLWIRRNPSLPRDSWQPFYWLGHHSRAAVAAHSWRTVDHCQTIDVDRCRQMSSCSWFSDSVVTTTSARPSVIVMRKFTPWPCVMDSMVYPPTGSKANVQEMSTPPMPIGAGPPLQVLTQDTLLVSEHSNTHMYFWNKMFFFVTISFCIRRHSTASFFTPSKSSFSFSTAFTRFNCTQRSSTLYINTEYQLGLRRQWESPTVNNIARIYHPIWLQCNCFSGSAVIKQS